MSFKIHKKYDLAREKMSFCLFFVILKFYEGVSRGRLRRNGEFGIVNSELAACGGCSWFFVLCSLLGAARLLIYLGDLGGLA